MPTWHHFSAKNPPTSKQRSIAKGGEYLIDFIFECPSMFVRSALHLGSENGAKLPSYGAQDAPESHPKRVRKAHLGAKTFQNRCLGDI